MSDSPDFTEDIIPIGQLGPDDIAYLQSADYHDSDHRKRIIDGAYDLWESVYQHPAIKNRRAAVNEHGLEPIQVKCPKKHPLMTIRIPGSFFDDLSPTVGFEVVQKFAGTVKDSRRDVDGHQYSELTDLERVTFHCSACRQRNPNANVTMTLQRLLAVYLAAVLQGKRWAILN